MISLAASRGWGDDKEGCDRAQEAGTEPGERSGVIDCGQWGKQELAKNRVPIQLAKNRLKNRLKNHLKNHLRFPILGKHKKWVV